MSPLGSLVGPGRSYFAVSGAGGNRDRWKTGEGTGAEFGEGTTSPQAEASLSFILAHSWNKVMRKCADLKGSEAGDAGLWEDKMRDIFLPLQYL